MSREIRYLSADEISDLADIEDYIEIVRKAYSGFKNNKTDPRTKLFHSQHDGMLMYYGALLPKIGAMGVFSYIGEFPNGGDCQLTFLADAETGLPLSVVDSAQINPYKTGAVGALGVDMLANKNASKLGIVGSGIQAKGQLLATSEVRELEDVKVYSPTYANRKQFEEKMDPRIAGKVRAVDTVEKAVADVDIIITATTAKRPIIKGDMISAGTHITAMGQSHPECREVDSEIIARAKYVPDHTERAKIASGELLIPCEEGIINKDHIHAELGEVVSGSRPGRSNESDITVFDSGGTGIETVAAAYLIYQRALDEGRGTKLPLTSSRDSVFDVE